MIQRRISHSDMSKYPRIGQIELRKKNVSAKCFCGSIGVAKVHMQYNIFRGEDEVMWACSEHKKDTNYLVAEYIKAIRGISDED